MKYGSKDTERDWQNFWSFWATVWALLHPPPSSTPDGQTDGRKKWHIEVGVQPKKYFFIGRFCKSWFYFFFSHLLSFKNVTIFKDTMLPALILLSPFFKCFAFFRFPVPSQKLDMNNRIRIIFIKIIIIEKINVIKIFSKNMSLTSNIFIMKD